jgi:prepilin-type N-terminal cleavage/methylation domain-containing protein
MNKKCCKFGFTLIELSIVLVIIGLVVGGVLAGKELMRTAELRSLISQVDQFKIATNTFKGKYNALPGDMLPIKASQFGFFTFVGAAAGTDIFGNNDGIIAGYAEIYCAYECGAYWRHLADAGLIQGNYGKDGAKPLQASIVAGIAGAPTGEDDSTPLSNVLYMPISKGEFGFVGAGSLVNFSMMYSIPGININQNFYYLQSPSKASRTSMNEPVMSAIDSYTIDLKIDDGKPNAGKFIVSTNEIITGNYDYWSATVNASSNVCTYGGSSDALALDVQYNANPSTGGNKKTCIPIFIW